MSRIIATVFATVFDNREIDPRGSRPLGEKGETLLVVHLPEAAINKRKRRRFRIVGEKQIEPLARSLAVSEVEMSRVFAPRTLALRAAQSATIASRSGTAAELL